MTRAVVWAAVLTTTAVISAVTDGWASAAVLAPAVLAATLPWSHR